MRFTSEVQENGVKEEVSLVEHCQLAVVPDEAMVEVSEAQESLKLF